MQILNLMALLVILIIPIIILFLFFIKEILNTLNSVSKVCRWFISENSGFFKILFITLFFIEQVVFIYVFNKYFNIPKEASVFIGIFALIVVTTASLQVFIWEYKYYHSEQQLKSVRHIGLLTEKYEYMIDKFKEILKKK